MDLNNSKNNRVHDAGLLYEELKETVVDVQTALSLRGMPALPPLIAAIANVMVTINRFEMIARAKGLTEDAARLIQAHRHEHCGLNGPCQLKSLNASVSIQRCNLAGQVIAMYGLTEPI